MMRTGRALAFAAVLLVWNTWGYDLWAPDEPYFAEGAREMVADGEWAVPHVNGVVTTDKPPLFFWLIAAFSLPAGQVGSFTARLPSVLAMLAATALTIRLARRLSGEAAGTVAGLVFVTTYLVWDKGRSAQIDAMLCLLILLALSAFEAFRAGDLPGRRAGLLFWAAAALATLAKGPVGFLVPLGIALVTLAVDRDARAWKRFAPLAGPAVFLGIVAAWMALATVGGHGTYSVWAAFKQHVLNRALHGMHHKQPFWYYAQVLPVQLVPWSGLVPAALVLAWRRRGADDRFLLVWAAFVVAFFSVPVEKRDLYVLPAYPAFAILVARVVGAVDSGIREAPRRLATISHAVVGALLTLAGVAVPFAAGRSGELSPAVAVVPAVALAATGIASLVLAARDRLRPAVLATIAGTAATYLAIATTALPALNPVMSARAFSESLATKTAASRAAGHDVLAYEVGNLPQAFALYTRGLYTKETSDPAVLERHFAQAEQVFAVADERSLEQLQASTREHLVVLSRARLNGRSVVIAANR